MAESQKDKWKDMVGVKYGKLTVVEIIEPTHTVEWFGCMVRCVCECGKEHLVGRRYLVRGSSKSCGKCMENRSFYHVTPQ